MVTFGINQKQDKYRVSLAESQQDLRDAQSLRERCFGVSCDADAFDTTFTHLLVRRSSDHHLVASCRLLHMTGDDVAHSYSALHYDLTALTRYSGTMVEIGRFCIDPRVNDPDVLRITWAALTSYVDQNNIAMLFGCASFPGTKTDDYLDAFAMLKDRHIAPKQWLPKIKAPKVFEYATRLRQKPDMKKAMSRMPPLLRTYLLMGGWVSDHAVVDDHMNTLHVFTGVEIGTIPAVRKRLLRSVAGI